MSLPNAGATRNSSNPGSMTVQGINNLLKEARSSYVLSKDSAGKAAAHVYMVWLATQSDDASSAMKGWLQKQVDDINTAIIAHNEAEDVLKLRADKLKDGKLPAEDAAVVPVKTKAEADEQAAVIKQLREIGGLDKKALKARKKVCVELADNELSHNGLVRFVLDLTAVGDTSTVSRYATVVRWLAERFKEEAPADADEVSQAIKSAGGFECVLDAQRDKEDGSSGAATEDEKDLEIRKNALLDSAKAALKTAPSKATFAMDVAHAPGGIIALLGRVVDGKVEVVGQLPVAEDEVDATVAKFCDAEALPTDASADFLANVIELGELVAEGGKTAKTTDGKKGGVALKAERALSVMPAGKGGIQLVMSARHASASIIVKALPTSKQVKLGSVTSPVCLASEDQVALAKLISAPEDRRLVTVAPKAKSKALAWAATDSALAAKSRANAVSTFKFDEVANQAEKPLDVDGFKPQVSVVITSEGLRALDEGRLAPWRKDKAADKTKRHVKLTFGNGKMTYDIEKDQPLSVKVKGGMSGACALNFRPRDICDVVAKLLATGAQSFELQADAGGMLRFSWADKLGGYEVYLPTVTNDKTLNPKRIEPMRCEEQQAEAA
jgi:hypothetical protein